MINKEELESIEEQLLQGKDVKMETTIDGIPYDVRFLAPDNSKNINIPSIIAIPKIENFNTQIALEGNNKESEDQLDIIFEGIQTGRRLAMETKANPSVIIVPLIPSYKKGPYFQQLSKESFDLPHEDKNYRIDEQIKNIISKTKEIVSQERGINLDNKIFLNGYSSSGVFAERFALLHPELVETACIGGASGSIPIPIPELDYPLGIGDYEQITGKKFNMDEYKKIRFTYYVGEFESTNKTNERFDDKGNPAPMHDMSFFDRSVPKEVGKKQRDLLGTDLIERANKSVEISKKEGINITHQVIPGRSHNNNSGHGVNEIGEQIVSATHKKSCELKTMINTSSELRSNSKQK